MSSKVCVLSAILIALTVSACSTTPVGLTYEAARAGNPVIQGKPALDVTAVMDQRKHDPNWLGAIRGGFGNPLKTLETPVPVKEVVKAAFVDGLKARNLQMADGPYVMELNVLQFDCNQYVRREAHAKVEVTVVERSSKRSVFRQSYEAEKITGSLVTMDAGIFASVDDLRVVANQTLQEVVDRALDDPKLRASLQ